MQAGSFVWYELTTPDPEAAARFYGEVTGWEMEESSGFGMVYTVAKLGQHRVAGLTAPPPGAPAGSPRWTGYLLADDVGAMADRIRGAGGAVYREPMDIPGVGRFAPAADPQGAPFMVFTGAGAPPPPLPPGTAGTFGWHELRTPEPGAALAFYQGLFGWEPAYAHDMGAHGVYQTFSIGGVWAGGIMPHARAEWLFYVTVEDIDAATARIVAAGGQVVTQPHQVPGGSYVLHATDSQGAAFALTGKRRE